MAARYRCQRASVDRKDMLPQNKKAETASAACIGLPLVSLKLALRSEALAAIESSNMWRRYADIAGHEALT